MSLLERAQDIDRRWIYLLTWVFVLFPLLNPLGLPVPIGRESRNWKNYIDNIPNDSVIIFSMDYPVTGMPELFPMTISTMHHLWTLAPAKNLKIVVISFSNQGPLIFDTLLDVIGDPASRYGVEYGVDWIELGWIPGGEIGMAAFATDVWGQAPRDYLEDRPLLEYPMMENIRTAEDVDLVVGILATGWEEWLRQWNTPYGVPFIFGIFGVGAPMMAPYIESGQVSAFLPGMTASAEYEILIDEPRLAAAASDALSMSHLLIILLVLIGNVAFFASGGKKKP